MKKSNNKKIIPIEDDENDDNEIEIIKQQKNNNQIPPKGKTSPKSRKDVGALLPHHDKVKIEELQHVEFVLGDYQNFDNLSSFSNMTSLTLVNQNIQNINTVINNIPKKENIKYFCLNENNITSLKGIEQLQNLTDLQMNFNSITEIDPSLSQLSKLKKIWLCENKITSIANLPNEVENLWIANNQIQSIPNDIAKYQNISNLNLAGNLLCNFDDIYSLQKLKNLKYLYLSDINFGDNPICQFVNYRAIMLHFFPDIYDLDQIIISQEERKEVSNIYNKKFLFYKNKIRHNHKICKMIFKLMKTNKLFMHNLKLQQSRFFSQRLKMLQYAKYEKEILLEVNNTNIDEIKKEIDASYDKLNICLKIMENIDENFKSIKSNLSQNNNFAIVSNFIEMETNGNFKIEAGNTNFKWTKSCIELIKGRIPKEFYKKNKIKTISFTRLFKFQNKPGKILFDALYDNLIDANGKFGEEKKYFDFYFLILPKEKANFQYIIPLILQDGESQLQRDNKMILCDNFSELDSYNFTSDPKQKFITLICKCVNFDSLIENGVCNENINNYESIAAEMNKVNTTKQIVNLVKNDINYYLYNIKELVLPEYLVEYEYILSNDDNTCYINDQTGFISSYNVKLELKNDYENLFNLCAKDLFSKENRQFYSNEIINKYSNLKFREFNELDNSMFFFNKNSLIGFISKCFKYQNFDEYKGEISKIKEKLGEIANLKFNKNINEIIFSPEEREKINIESITIVDLFNLELTDEKFNELLDKIVKESESNEKFLSFRNGITDLLIAKNDIKCLNFDKILTAFPNITKIDFSHNQIKEIVYKQSTKFQTNKIISIDISFNNISDFSYIVLILQSFNSISTLIYYGNPFKKHFTHFNDSLIDNSITQSKKETLINEYNKYIQTQSTQNQSIKVSTESILNNAEINHFNMLFDCYSLGDQYQNFSNIKYFKEKDNNENNLKSIILSKRKFLSIPSLENQKDIQILYISLNKITKIDNISQFANLIELYIQNNKITKIENLPNTLIKLDISNNELNTLDGIEVANKLKWLNIENNAIQSIIQIISLPKLSEFYSSGNNIYNIKECYQLKQLQSLEIVDISNNEVSANIHEFRYGMIFYCKQIKNLNRLNVDESEREKAIEFFTGRLTSEILEQRLGQGCDMKTLIELDLSGLKLKDEIGMFSKEKFPQLQKLNISKNLFKSFLIFGLNPNLFELNMNYNLFTCIFNKNEKKIANKGIFGLPALESIEIAGNTLSDINGIQLLKNLKIMVLRENNISKIEAINRMDNLSFLDISFNKLRSVERGNIGNLPNLQILLCDNNYLKNINSFAKFDSLQTASFENNKIYDFTSVEKLSILEQLKDFSILNNPITKIPYYRSKMIKIFDKLSKLDGIEITSEEKDMITLEMQMGDFNENPLNGFFPQGYPNQKMTSAAYNYNIQRIQDKGLKKVNYIQLDLSPHSFGNGGISRAVNLPQIGRPNEMYREKAITAEIKKKPNQNNSYGSNSNIALQKNIKNSNMGNMGINANQVKKSRQNKELYGFIMGSMGNELNAKSLQYMYSLQNKK